MDNYKEIKVPLPGQAPEPIVEHIEIDLDTKRKERVFKPSPRTQPESVEVIIDSIQEDQEETPVQPEVQERAPQRHEQKRPSRAQKRIRDLNSQLKEKDAVIEQERKEKAELLKKLNTDNKTSLETTKNNIQTQINTLNQQMRKAMQTGDTELVADLQVAIEELRDQIVDVKMNLKVAELESDQIEPEYKPVPKGPPEQAIQWMNDHKNEIRNDFVFKGAAFSVNEQLVQEGWDHNSDEFYEELSNRLAKKFPEYFGEFVLADENSVEYSQEAIIPSPVKDVKQHQQPAPRPQSPQTVSGASRTPNSSVLSRTPIENKVTLTPQDLEQMDRWGMSMERMARRKHHIEKNRRDDGYVPIMIPTETKNR